MSETKKPYAFDYWGDEPHIKYVLNTEENRLMFNELDGLRNGFHNGGYIQVNLNNERDCRIAFDYQFLYTNPPPMIDVREYIDIMKKKNVWNMPKHKS